MPRSIVSLLSFVSILFVAACYAPSVVKMGSTGCGPACPGAPQAVIGDAGVGLRGAPVQPAPALSSANEATSDERAPSMGAYLCPMHPHFGSDEPGRCPECNMKLVLRAEVLEHDHGN